MPNFAVRGKLLQAHLLTGDLNPQRLAFFELDTIGHSEMGTSTTVPGSIFSSSSCGWNGC